MAGEALQEIPGSDEIQNEEKRAETGQEKGADRNQWHPAFCSAVRLELLSNKDDLKFESEYNLSRKPLQIDLLVIKKSDDVTIQNEIGKIFRRHNIMEFKSPQDGLNIDDYFKVLAYACLYKSEGETVDEIKSDDVTISFVRDTKPVKLMKEFEKRSITVSEYKPGIYYVSDPWFFLQIIVTSELQREAHQWMRALSKRLSDDEAEGLLREASSFKGTKEEDLVDSVMTVSMAANKASFSNAKGESGMYQFVRILAEDEIKAGTEKGREEGMQLASVAVARRMLRKNKYSIEEIADNTDLPVEEVEKLASELSAELQLI